VLINATYLGKVTEAGNAACYVVIHAYFIARKELKQDRKKSLFPCFALEITTGNNIVCDQPTYLSMYCIYSYMWVDLCKALLTHSFNT
jgi:hypothetical protein